MYSKGVHLSIDCDSEISLSTWVDNLRVCLRGPSGWDWFGEGNGKLCPVNWATGGQGQGLSKGPKRGRRPGSGRSRYTGLAGRSGGQCGMGEEERSS